MMERGAPCVLLEKIRINRSLSRGQGEEAREDRLGSRRTDRRPGDLTRLPDPLSPRRVKKLTPRERAWPCLETPYSMKHGSRGTPPPTRNRPWLEFKPLGKREERFPTAEIQLRGQRAERPLCRLGTHVARQP